MFCMLFNVRALFKCFETGEPCPWCVNKYDVHADDGRVKKTNRTIVFKPSSECDPAC